MGVRGELEGVNEEKKGTYSILSTINIFKKCVPWRVLFCFLTFFSKLAKENISVSFSKKRASFGSPANKDNRIGTVYSFGRNNLLLIFTWQTLIYFIKSKTNVGRLP